MPLQIGGRPDHDPSRLAERPDDQRRIRQPPDADGEVHALLHQVDPPVGEQEVALHLGVAPQVLRQERGDVQMAEGGGRGDGEAAGGAQPVGLREILGLLHLGQDAAGAVEVAGPRIGQLDGAGGPLEQPQAEMLLQRRHLPRDGRGREAEMPRGGREALAVGDGDEGRHGGETVHGIIADRARIKCQSS